MDFEKFVRNLPESGEELIAKAKRVDALKLEALSLELEVWTTINSQWSAREQRLASRK